MNGLSWRLRTNMCVPRDLFYQKIWPYIPDPPQQGPPQWEGTVDIYTFQGRHGIVSRVDVYGYQRAWQTCNGITHIIDHYGSRLCMMCEHRLDVTSMLNDLLVGANKIYSKTDICADCDKLIESRRNDGFYC